MRFTSTVILIAVASIPVAAQSLPRSAAGHQHGSTQADVIPLYRNLGTHGYRVRATEEAQRYFDQGLRFLWAFNHADAIRSFREGERRDPRCGMCAWGIALAAGPNINAAMESEALDTARAAVARARRQAEDPGERRLIDALAKRYAPGPADDQPRRDTAYATAMAAVVEADPEDLEARVLHADAVMNLSPWNYWNADKTPRPATPVVLGQLERVSGANPSHPGACHLYIHAVEAADPHRALPCAERLAALMPGAGHLVHMPGHIYIRVGRYADAVRANQHAVHADAELLEGPAARRRGLYGSGYYPHNHHFLAFAATMMGASRLAIEHAAAAARGIDPAIAAAVPWVDAITPISYWTLVAFERWDQVLAEPLPAPERRFTVGMAYYARGMAFAARRRWAEARAALDSVRRVAAAHPAGDNQAALAIAERALRGEVALRRGALSDAVREFRAAVEVEDQLPYTEPPTWYHPMRRFLGKAYLAQGKGQAAEQAFREDLERFPANGWSLYGLAAALKQQRRFEESSEVLRRFQEAWVDADIAPPTMQF